MRAAMCSVIVGAVLGLGGRVPIAHAEAAPAEAAPARQTPALPVSAPSPASTSQRGTISDAQTPPSTSAEVVPAPEESSTRRASPAPEASEGPRAAEPIELPETGWPRPAGRRRAKTLASRDAVRDQVVGLMAGGGVLLGLGTAALVTGSVLMVDVHKEGGFGYGMTTLMILAPGVPLTASGALLIQEGILRQRSARLGLSARRWGSLKGVPLDLQAQMDPLERARFQARFNNAKFAKGLGVTLGAASMATLVVAGVAAGFWNTVRVIPNEAAGGEDPLLGPGYYRALAAAGVLGVVGTVLFMSGRSTQSRLTREIDGRLAAQTQTQTQARTRPQTELTLGPGSLRLRF